jgi:hypothetical protein
MTAPSLVLCCQPARNFVTDYSGQAEPGYRLTAGRLFFSRVTEARRELSQSRRREQRYGQLLVHVFAHAKQFGYVVRQWIGHLVGDQKAFRAFSAACCA